MPSAAWAQFRFGLSLAIFISLPTWSGGGENCQRERGDADSKCRQSVGGLESKPVCTPIDNQMLPKV